MSDVATAVTTYHNYIGGEWVAAADGRDHARTAIPPPAS